MKSLRNRKDQPVFERSLRRQAPTCLPSEVSDDVPQCAHACILRWVVQTFPHTDCTSTSNLNYLCTTHTPTGLTLGEAALQCVASDCGSQATQNTLLSAYRVCEGVDNAVPNTRTVINATIRPGPTQAPTIQNAAPATFTPSSSTSAVGIVPTSMVISDDNMTLTMEMMMSVTGSAPTPAPTMTEVGSNFVPEQTGESGLSTAQIAGLSSGVGVAALVIVGIILFCLRERRRAKQDSQPSMKQNTNPKMPASRAAATPSPTAMPGQSNRRSFWRKSILPQDIGIAVPGRVKSRDSISSEKSILKPLSATISGQGAGDRSSWPDFAAGNVNHPPARPPRDSISTIFDEDVEQQPSQALGNTPYDRYRAVPQPLQFDRSTTASPSSDTTAEKSLSLTPTYDNGHFSQVFQVPPVQNSIDATLASNAAYSSREQPRRSSEEESASPRRKLQKKASTTTKAMISSPVSTGRGPMAFAAAKGSDYTSKTRPETKGSVYTTASRPETNASLFPQPLQPFMSRPYSPEATSKGFRPSEVASTRNGASVYTTASFSSDVTSQSSLDFPIPPSRPTTKGGFAASRGSQPVSALNYAQWYDPARDSTSQGQPQSAQQQLSPNSRAKVTPTQKNSIGDLFFKVEMQ